MKKLVYGIGINDWNGQVCIKGKNIKEYNLWKGMIQRCFDEKLKLRQNTYNDVTCCDRWISFKCFIDVVGGIENFNKYISDGWCMDKDIISKE